MTDTASSSFSALQVELLAQRASPTAVMSLLCGLTEEQILEERLPAFLYMHHMHDAFVHIISSATSTRWVNDFYALLMIYDNGYYMDKCAPAWILVGRHVPEHLLSDVLNRVQVMQRLSTTSKPMATTT